MISIFMKQGPGLTLFVHTDLMNRSQIDITTYQIRKIKADMSLCLFADEIYVIYTYLLGVAKAQGTLQLVHCMVVPVGVAAIYPLHTLSCYQTFAVCYRNLDMNAYLNVVTVNCCGFCNLGVAKAEGTLQLVHCMVVPVGVPAIYPRHTLSY